MGDVLGKFAPKCPVGSVRSRRAPADESFARDPRVEQMLSDCAVRNAAYVHRNVGVRSEVDVFRWPAR